MPNEDFRSTPEEEDLDDETREAIERLEDVVTEAEEVDVGQLSPGEARPQVRPRARTRREAEERKEGGPGEEEVDDVGDMPERKNRRQVDEVRRDKNLLGSNFGKLRSCRAFRAEEARLPHLFPLAAQLQLRHRGSNQNNNNNSSLVQDPGRGMSCVAFR